MLNHPKPTPPKINPDEPPPRRLSRPPREPDSWSTARAATPGQRRFGRPARCSRRPARCSTRPGSVLQTPGLGAPDIRHSVLQTSGTRCSRHPAIRGSPGLSGASCPGLPAHSRTNRAAARRLHTSGRLPQESVAGRDPQAARICRTADFEPSIPPDRRFRTLDPAGPSIPPNRRFRTLDPAGPSIPPNRRFRTLDPAGPSIPLDPIPSAGRPPTLTPQITYRARSVTDRFAPAVTPRPAHDEFPAILLFGSPRRVSRGTVDPCLAHGV